MLTEKDIRIIGTAYWLNLVPSEDGKETVNVAGICRDSRKGRTVVENVIKELTTTHRGWLDKIRPLVEAELDKFSVEKQVVRLRNVLAREVALITAETMPIIAELNAEVLAQAQDYNVKTSSKQKYDQLVATQKIKGYNCDKAVGRISRLVGIVERLEAAIHPRTPINNIGQQIVAINPEEKRSRFLRMEGLMPLTEANADNGS